KVNDYDNLFVGGKRNKVRLASSFDIEQVYRYGFGELVFETTDLPFAESIGTTQDIEGNGINSNDELWGFGMVLRTTSIDPNNPDESLHNSHDVVPSEPFRVLNTGYVLIHPLEQEWKIKIKNIVGIEGAIQLRHHTNQDYLRITCDSIKVN